MAVWIKKENRWDEVLSRDYFSSRELKVESIPNGILLPPKGGACGVCDSQNKWVAGLMRSTPNAKPPFLPYWLGYLKAYPIEKESLVQRDESVVFGGVLIKHFGHCLIDSLNRLWWCLKDPNDSRKIVFFGGGGPLNF